MADDAAPTRRTPGQGIHLLVVDDERVVRRALQRILERDGYTVSVAEGGREALEIYERQWRDFL